MTNSSDAARQRITLERSFTADVKDVWELWTTKDGIEAWWGPEGFRVEVRKLDLRAGGELHYAMIAEGEPQIAFMQKAGMPTITEAKITYTEVTAEKRLAYLHSTSFVPGVEPYELGTVVELEVKGAVVHLRLTVDAMHDDVWTGRMVAGWESELGKLERTIAARRAT